MNNIVALAASGSVVALISAVVGGFFAQRKISAEASQLITQAGAGIATTVEGFVDRITKENSDLRADNKNLTDKVNALTRENLILQTKVDTLMEKVEQLTQKLMQLGDDTKITRETTERIEREQHRHSGGSNHD